MFFSRTRKYLTLCRASVIERWRARPQIVRAEFLNTMAGCWYTDNIHNTNSSLRCREGGGPRVVVSTAAFHAWVRGSVPGLGGLKETKLFLPHPRVKVSIVGSLRDREVACSALDRQGSNFESCVWRTVSSQSSHHPQEVLLAQFSLYVHKGGLKPDLFLLRCRDSSALRKYETCSGFILLSLLTV